jgi:hypothetical protein
MMAVAAVGAAAVHWNFGTVLPCSVLHEAIRQSLPDGRINFGLEKCQRTEPKYPSWPEPGKPQKRADTSVTKRCQYHALSCAVPIALGFRSAFLAKRQNRLNGSGEDKPLTSIARWNALNAQAVERSIFVT